MLFYYGHAYDCHDVAMLWPWYCHSVAMILLPCYCHATAMLLPRVAMILPCYGHAFAMLLQ
eukprot:8994911-Lingulodinium_polyedra.AAC.1